MSDNIVAATAGDTTKPVFISAKDVVRRVGLSRHTIWRLQRAGKFPRAVLLSTQRKGFKSEDVDAWIAAKCAEA